MRSIMKIRVRWKSRVSIKMMRFTIKFGIMISQLINAALDDVTEGKGVGYRLKKYHV